MGDLSIDAANKIRASMGMPLLPVPGAAAPAAPAFKAAKGDGSHEEAPSTVETRQAASYGNWQKIEDDRLAKKKRDDRTALLKKNLEKAQRYAEIQGKGLADEAGDQDDVDWLKNTKKRQKKIAKAEKMRQELEERERQAKAAIQYTEADLAGVKVGHEVDQFDDGEDQILVLKDTAVDADEDDELEAVALKEREKLQEKLDSKKRKRAYDPNEVEDESAEKVLLSQYDDAKSKAFTLDGQGRTLEDKQLEAEGAAKPKRVAISLEMLYDDSPRNDYMDISDIKIKKPKKKKSKSSKRKHIEDEDDAPDTPAVDADDMEMDEQVAVVKTKKKKVFDESFVDDDDLQATLAAQRQKALKKRKKMRPEDVARQLREETSAPATPDVQNTTEFDEEPALVIDETTEFVTNMQRSASEDGDEEQRRLRHSRIESVGAVAEGYDDDGDFDMGPSYVEAAEAADAQERSESQARSVGLAEAGLDQEKTIDQGMGATLALLRERGILSTADSSDPNAVYRERQKFLAEKQRAEAAAERLAKERREKERASARWQNSTAREREERARQLNIDHEKMESRKIADVFNHEYKPNIELKYADEHGRQMTKKEAFKVLSHQFHGKGSGNTKTQKHLDKIKNEKRKMAENSLDTSRTKGMSNAQDQQAKKHKQAGVRIQ